MTQKKKESDWYIIYRNRNNYEYLFKILQKHDIPYYTAVSMVEEYKGDEIVNKEYESIKNLIFIQLSESGSLFFNKLKTDFGIDIIPYIDCMTGEPAKVGNDEMERFIMLSKNDPDSIEILKDRFEKFCDRPRVRVKAGPYEGLEGRLVRIRRDRKVVISLGTNAISISGIHFSLLDFNF